MRCNRCNRTTLTTGQIQKELIRTYARSLGWIRGLRATKIVDPATEHLPVAERIVLPPNLRSDICPACAPVELREAEDRKRRAALRRAKRTDPRQVAA